MKIAYLAWGSLVWDPRDLPLRRPWFSDGPLLPVEFCRQSQDDRITLVITPGKPEVRVLWGLSLALNVDEVVECLRMREKTHERYIGLWSVDKPKPEDNPTIIHWANNMGLDAVVWTALPPKFKSKDGVIPSTEEVIRHLKGLPAEKKRNAELYVRKAPIQIDTDYRRYIESEMGWTRP
jgi:hypothetical protein